MDIGRVVGSIWATKKDDNMNGQKLLVLKMLLERGKEKPELVVAADIIGAGVGDLVLVVRGGAARYAVHNPNCPIDAAIVGIVDSIEVEDND
ncbi:ethanolamine utilization protein EutN [Sporanaerobium hydrogeniformans]|uniref:Ethanolamine utilization protein EutN n=1 Tax=Sporanaerobium hydrogeniformans TaxID=3072179 RepID=A0AC61DAH0_9FIRM|nr:EutN/CcmL family microcompartment protein [Sporanaerobium hydrogeniformans]PHV70294.1 ethanolamine utilization protein EutN [Sporanaerobium hydrogeniformans]